jgi:RNA polymerase-interacting CarD/CdnL/TRCF family regulator
MKLQPTCAICLSKIKLVDLRYGVNRKGPGRKLLCKHVFHASCIKSMYKPQCPLCEHPIFNNDEEALFTCASEEEVISILKNLHEYNINMKNMFTFLTTDKRAIDKYKWIVDLIYKYYDFTQLLAENLDNKKLVKEIVARGKINWFKTFYGGSTFSDLVHERTSDAEIIALIHDRLPIDSKRVTVPSSSTINTSFGTVNVTQTVPTSVDTLAFFQRHRRMDSMSGAAMENQLRRPDIVQTATVRRSLRGLRPPLIEIKERSVFEQPQTYPIYERLYPVVPSAPPIELM